jgi:hypothetical protein
VSGSLLGCSAEGPQEVGGLGCFRGRRENRSRVLAQQLQPVGDILRVPELSLNVEVSAQERRAQLRYQLLGRVGFRAKAVVKLAVQSMLGARPMTLMPISA